MEAIKENNYFDRDLSWLSFNERILMEAGRSGVPVGERLCFLGIFASNLDEFYRVRMPAILALNALPADMATDAKTPPLENKRLCQVRDTIDRLQRGFGDLMRTEILPMLYEAGVDFKYNSDLPSAIDLRIQAFFYEKVAAFLTMVWLPDLPQESAIQNKEEVEKLPKKRPRFFPENDTIYLAVFGKRAGKQGVGIIRIPSANCGRFMRLDVNSESEVEPKSQDKGIRNEVWLLDDIIRMHIHQLAGKDDFQVEGSYSFKLSRDADIDYKDEYGKDIAGFIQKQIGKRSFGLATRLLFDANIPAACLDKLRAVLKCPEAALVKGGRYHNLRDLMKFPIQGQGVHYEKWPPTRPDYAAYTNIYTGGNPGQVPSLLDEVDKNDLLISTPYQDYNTVLRFFNEAAISPEVTSIAVTLYRIAKDSLIANALMTAAKNGKKVTVFVELKARFDEANNIKWATLMKSAGVKIVYSIWALKVHAKIALVKREKQGRLHYSGIVATGNFNENTAGLYADHILMTANKEMLADMETLLIFLEKRTRPAPYRFFQPKQLLIAGFNLQEVFLNKIHDCTQAALKGQQARITIKLNNLEEEKLIDALYEASRAGVEIRMMVRSICRLIPGVPGMSENITIFRLVDRYLEHSRIFIFEAGSKQDMYIGSADWMNRNIYRRIEVCCPVLDKKIQSVIAHIIALQFADRVHLVQLTSSLENKWVQEGAAAESAGKSSSNSKLHNSLEITAEAQAGTYRYLNQLADLSPKAEGANMPPGAEVAEVADGAEVADHTGHPDHLENLKPTPDKSNLNDPSSSSSSATASGN